MGKHAVFVTRECIFREYIFDFCQLSESVAFHHDMHVIHIFISMRYSWPQVALGLNADCDQLPPSTVRFSLLSIFKRCRRWPIVKRWLRWPIILMLQGVTQHFLSIAPLSSGPAFLAGPGHAADPPAPGDTVDGTSCTSM